MPPIRSVYLTQRIYLNMHTPQHAPEVGAAGGVAALDGVGAHVAGHAEDATKVGEVVGAAYDCLFCVGIVCICVYLCVICVCYKTTGAVAATPACA